MFISSLAVILGFILDMVLGDPHYSWHPVCIIGNFIAWCEKKIRKIIKSSHRSELVGGGVLVAIVVFVSIVIPYGILYLAGHIHPLVRLTIETIFCYQLLATKSLKDESMKVYSALKEGNLEKSRKAVAMIVGRDTNVLNEEGITKATVETVAENTSDGSIAPLFYMVIFGALGGFFYKAINTMDSMIGYKNDKYLYFGRVAAKLDDLVNYIPARLSAYLMILSSYLLSMNWRNAIRIYRRDRRNHASPNSAHTEAVVAGALDIQLAGDAVYFGKLYPKKTIGDKNRRIEIEDIEKANELLFLTAILGLVIFFMVKLFFLVHL